MDLRYVWHKVRRFLSPAYGRKQLIAAGLRVGRNVTMLRGCDLDPTHCWLIEIGDDVVLAPNVTILAHDTSAKMVTGLTRIARVRIGNRVFIGAGSIVLPGVTVGDDVVIGAGSVVSRDIPSGHVAAGNPAKVVCTLDSYRDRRCREMAAGPRYGVEWTVRGGITPAMKDQMRADLRETAGYLH